MLDTVWPFILSLQFCGGAVVGFLGGMCYSNRQRTNPQDGCCCCGGAPRHRGGYAGGMGYSNTGYGGAGYSGGQSYRY